MQPLISVIIPTFNRSNLLERAINSLIDQEYNNWEAIIIDNYSTDITHQVINNFNDNRLKYIKLHNNGIIAKSRNLGISMSKGEWIAFLDSDDWWDKDKLFTCSKFINKDTDFVYHRLRVVRESKKKLFKKNFLRTRKLSKPIIEDLLINGNNIQNSSVIVRKKLLIEVGKLSEDKSIVTAEDFNLWLRLATITDKFTYIPKTLGSYFIHEDNSLNHDSWRFTEKACEPFLYLLNEKKRSLYQAQINFIKGKCFYHAGDYSSSIKSFSEAQKNRISFSRILKIFIFKFFIKVMVLKKDYT